MSSKKTPNLGLHEWVPTDYVQMEEFNENFKKLDEVGGAADQLSQDVESINIQLEQTVRKEEYQKEIGSVKIQLEETAKKSEVQSLVMNKAEKTYVETELIKKADKTEINSLASAKADKVFVDTSVSLLHTKINSHASGSPKGVYSNLSALQTAFPTGNSNTYVVKEDGYSYYWDGTSWTRLTQYQSTGFINAQGYYNSTSVEGALQEIAENTFSMINNQINNGDFLDGTNGFTVNATGTLNVSNGIATFLATGKSGRFSKLNLTRIANHKYYIFSRFKSTSNQVCVHTNTTPSSIFHSGSGLFERKSAIITPSSTSLDWQLGIMDTRDANWNNVEVDYIGVIDLTTAFGLGYEPEKDAMDSLMEQYNGYIEGKVNLFNVKEVMHELRSVKEEFVTIMDNVILNGDFRNGLIGWTNGTATSNLSITNNTLSIIGNGSNAIPRAIYTTSKNVISGHKYYGICTVKVKNESCERIWVESYAGTTYLGLFGEVLKPVKNSTYTIAGILSATNQNGILDFRVLNRYLDSASSLDKVMEVQNVMLIDLTEVFGKGNEPSLKQMENIISNFGYIQTVNLFDTKKLISNIYKGTDVNVTNKYFYTPTGTDSYDGTGKSGLNAETITTAQLYSLWDSLIAQYPNQLTKSILGKDASGQYDIWRINFKPMQPKAKILISANVHGNSEWGDPADISLVLYEFIKDILSNGTTNEAMTFFRYNIEIEMIPCANPWGYNNDTRENSRGVDMNRNFFSPTPEAETVIMQNWLQANKDAILYVDQHAYAFSRTDNMLKVYANADGGSENYVAREVGEYIAQKQSLVLSVSDALDGMTITYGWKNCKIPSITPEYPVYLAGKVTHGQDMTTRFLEWMGSYLYRYTLQNYNINFKKLEDEIDLIKSHLGLS